MSYQFDTEHVEGFLKKIIRSDMGNTSTANELRSLALNLLRDFWLNSSPDVPIGEDPNEIIFSSKTWTEFVYNARNRKLIDCIRLVRAITNMSLKTAKEWVDHWKDKNPGIWGSDSQPEVGAL